MRSELGEVKLVVDYGKNPGTGQWGCPVRAARHLGEHQKLTPGFAEKLGFTATATGAYEEAAQVASKWAQTIDDATLHALVQRMGARAEAQAQKRYEKPPAERWPQRGPSELGVLMVDGCQLRYRGPGWGKKKTKQDRVEWHELKLGVFYRHEASARTQKGRGLLIDKLVVNWQDQALELGRRLNWEALHEGLGRARKLLYLGDGAEWVWNLQQDRWKEAQGLLDFYHGSEHLWSLGRALHGEKEPALAQWVKPLRHQVRHGQERQARRQFARLKQRSGEAGKVIRREQNYFKTHAGRMNYQTVAKRGWPIGSGAVESACRQKQCRFKRCGQFWSKEGLRNLCALDEARRNHHWDELWSLN
ncbi:MAG TPA: hypothetical protein VF492_00265 [Verrucomicrobiae bacterium]